MATSTDPATVWVPPVYRGRVDADAAVAYAHATNDHNDLYLDGHAVPPLFTVSLALWSQMELGRAIRPGRIHDFTTGVHGEHDMRLLRPVLPDMALQWQATLSGLRQTKAGVMLIARVLVSDDDGAPLVEHLWSNFYPGARVDAEQGEQKPDHTFPEEARGRPAGTRVIPVERDQTYRYAGISGDHVPHAMDDEAARKEGFPGKILQGLCTLGICSGAVVDVGAARDPRRLRRLAARFAAPAQPRRDLVVEVYDNGETDDGARSFAFEASQDGAVVIKHGRAEVTAA